MKYFLLFQPLNTTADRSTFSAVIKFSFVSKKSGSQPTAKTSAKWIDPSCNSILARLFTGKSPAE